MGRDFHDRRRAVRIARLMLRRLDEMGGGYNPASPDETAEEIAAIRAERDRRNMGSD